MISAQGALTLVATEGCPASLSYVSILFSSLIHAHLISGGAAYIGSYTLVELLAKSQQV